MSQNKKKAQLSPQMVESYLADMVKPVLYMVGMYGERRDRLVCSSADLIPSEKGDWTIRIHVTRGLPALLPFVPQDHVSRLDADYFEQMRALRVRYGSDVRKWPPDAYGSLDSGDYLDFTFHFEKINKNGAKFCLQIALNLEGRSILIKRMGEPDWYADGPATKWYRCGHSDEERARLMDRVVWDWLIAGDNWKIADDRMLEEYCEEMRDALESRLGQWQLELDDIPRNGFAMLLYAPGNTALANMRDSDLKIKCRRIIGDVFEPGLPAAFVIHIWRDQKANTAEVAVRGPIPYNPGDGSSMVDILARGAEADLLFEQQIPMKRVRQQICNRSYSGDFVCTAGHSSRDAVSIMEALGIDEDEDEFEDGSEDEFDGWEEWEGPESEN